MTFDKRVGDLAQREQEQLVGAVIEAELRFTPVFADQHIVEIAGKEVGEIESGDAGAEIDQFADAVDLARQARAPARAGPVAKRRQHGTGQRAGEKRPVGAVDEGPGDRYGQPGDSACHVDTARRANCMRRVSSARCWAPRP